MTGGGSGGDWLRSPPPNAQIIYKIGIYGWRKRCLYLFILIMMLIIIINMALTIWILRVMDFSLHGMGKLRISKDGIRVEGTTEVLDNLYTSHISSRPESGLFLESFRNISLNARDEKNKIINRLFLGDSIASYSNSFQIKNRNGKLLFAADDQQIQLGTDKLTFTDEGGAKFTGSVQTPLVRAEASQSLRLESPTRNLLVSGTKGVELKSPGGALTLQSLEDLRLISNGAIRIDATNITLKNLKVSQARGRGRHYPSVYQLCVCEDNGRLFVSAPDGHCRANKNTCN